MTAVATRRAFLRRFSSADSSSAIRPPWSRAETVFVQSCDRCGDCLKVCSEKIIVNGDGGFPVVDFQHGECTLCGDCAKACKTGALIYDAEQPAWNMEPTISDACLALKAVTCRVCGDFCEPRALRFRLVVGGRAEPVIDAGLCNGCGACVAPCPVKAVSIGSAIQA